MTNEALALTEIETSIFNLVVSMCKIRETVMRKGWIEARNETADFLASVAVSLRVSDDDIDGTREAKISAFLTEMGQDT